MSGYGKLMIVIADGEHVRFVQPAENNALHSVSSLDSVAAHKQSSDLGSDHPGASYHSDSTAHHAVQPRHDPHELEKQKFAGLVAGQLNQAASQHAFDALVLVAPAHTLSAIRERLDAVANAMVVGTLTRDLVNTPDDELWPHLRQWVRPVHRPAG
jgi:protein required for attachment to host cells